MSPLGFDSVLLPWSKGCGEGDCCHGASVEVHARVRSWSDRGGPRSGPNGDRGREVVVSMHVMGLFPHPVTCFFEKRPALTDSADFLQVQGWWQVGCTLP